MSLFFPSLKTLGYFFAMRTLFHSLSNRAAALFMKCLFGSVARDDSSDESDVDFLVRLEPGRSLLDQGGLLMDLRQLLGVNVNVVSEGALTGRFGQIVRAEAVPL